MSDPESGWRLEWERGPFAVSPARARLYEDVVLAPEDDALREAYAAMAIAEGDPVGEHVRLSLLRERAPAPWIDEALVDLRARYGRAIFAPWCTSPFGRSLGRWLESEVATGVLRRGLIGHFPGFDRELPVAERLGPIESVAASGPHACRVGSRVRDFGSVIDESFAANDAMAPRRLLALWSRPPSFSLARLEELSLIAAPGADASLLTRIVEAAPSLRRLSFRVARLEQAAVDAIAALPHLEHLGIEAHADWSGVARRAGTFPALRSLGGWGTGGALVAEMARRGRLETLSVTVNHTDELISLLAALGGAPLKSLSLAGEPDMDANLI